MKTERTGQLCGDEGGVLTQAVTSRSLVTSQVHINLESRFTEAEKGKERTKNKVADREIIRTAGNIDT
jgi:hypothetical protein